MPEKPRGVEMTKRAPETQAGAGQAYSVYHNCSYLFGDYRGPSWQALRMYYLTESPQPPFEAGTVIILCPHFADEDTDPPRD